MLQQLDDHLARTDLTRALPQRAYSAPEVFELEAERVFRNEWLAVCGSEDLPEASFAGQQETLLNIKGLDNIIKALHEVFASLYNDRAIAYRVHQGFDHGQPAVPEGGIGGVEAERL